MRRELLTDAEVASAKDAGWEVVDGKLSRSFALPTFLAAIDFVREVAAIAEELDHHPDIDIRWRTVHLATSTHDRGGITDWDLELARRADALIS